MFDLHNVNTVFLEKIFLHATTGKVYFISLYDLCFHESSHVGLLSVIFVPFVFSVFCFVH